MYNEKEVSKKLAYYIKQRRKDLKITQEVLSEKSLLDYKHVQRLESYTIKNDPKLSTLVKLAKSLDVKVNDILDHIIKQ